MFNNSFKAKIFQQYEYGRLRNTIIHKTFLIILNSKQKQPLDQFKC